MVSCFEGSEGRGYSALLGMSCGTKSKLSLKLNMLLLRQPVFGGSCVARGKQLNVKLQGLSVQEAKTTCNIQLELFELFGSVLDQAPQQKLRVFCVCVEPVVCAVLYMETPPVVANLTPKALRSSVP
jgi:hypothetical protein